jgi:hypothetical protein
MTAVCIVLSALLGLWSGAAAAGLYQRIQFRRIGPTFRAKVRSPAYAGCGPLPGWPRRTVRAVWVKDVLFVDDGIVRPRVRAFTPCAAERAILHTTRLEVRRLGADPVVLRLRLDGGGVAEVAARDEDIGALAGPFVTAALAALPPSRIRRTR